MATVGERNWTAHLVISSEHVGLRPYFRRLEDELRHVLARIDDPRDVKRYLSDLLEHSKRYMLGIDAPRYKK